MYIQIYNPDWLYTETNLWARVLALYYFLFNESDLKAAVYYYKQELLIYYDYDY